MDLCFANLLHNFEFSDDEINIFYNQVSDYKKSVWNTTICSELVRRAVASQNQSSLMSKLIICALQYRRSSLSVPEFWWINFGTIHDSSPSIHFKKIYVYFVRRELIPWYYQDSWQKSWDFSRSCPRETLIMIKTSTSKDKRSGQSNY